METEPSNTLQKIMDQIRAMQTQMQRLLSGGYGNTTKRAPLMTWQPASYTASRYNPRVPLQIHLYAIPYQNSKAEPSKLSYNNFLVKGENDKRKAFKELKNHIERHISLCTGIWRHESHKKSFLRDVLVIENCAENTLSRVEASNSWRGLSTELGNALKICIEREDDSHEIMAPEISSISKPNIFFASPGHAKKMSKAIFPGSE